MTDRLYTAKQVARLIAYTGSDSEITQVIRKIRHWSANDVLVPLGGKNTGTGVSRVYDDLQVRIAAIVYELTRYGVTVEMLDTFNEYIADGICFMDEWKEAVNDEADFILALTWGGDGAIESTYRIVREGEPLTVATAYHDKIGSTFPSAILVNLRTIFRRIRL